MKQPLRGPALYKAIREYLKQYIIEQELKPGDALPPEGQLVEELGVGRSTVREAVKSLQSLGIVEVRQGDGLYVRELNFDPMLEAFQFGMQFDPHTVSELLQIRIFLEMAVIGDAVPKIDADEIEQLESILNQWEARIQSEKEYYDLDEDFHRVIYSVLGNNSLLKLFEVFWIAFLGLEVRAIRESDPVVELQSHQLILDAIKSGDSGQTRKELLGHFAHVKARINEYILSTEAN